MQLDVEKLNLDELQSKVLILLCKDKRCNEQKKSLKEQANRTVVLILLCKDKRCNKSAPKRKKNVGEQGVNPLMQG